MNAAIIVFGATGDLAKKKIMPALFAMYRKKNLVNTPIVAIGRRAMTKDEYLSESGAIHFKNKNEDVYNIFASNLFYQQVEIEDKHPAGLKSILERVDREYHCNGEKIVYLAVSSELFAPILDLLKRAHALDRNKVKIAFEKPFGFDRVSAIKLNKEITRRVPEKQIYRVDHYLGKSMVDNLLAIRSFNPILTTLWNRENIDNIQVVAMEDFGIGERGDYYDRYGAVRDVVQNHLLQVLAITCMDPPKESSAEKVSATKLKILDKLRVPKTKDIVVGQYEGYLSEKNVSPNSKTETFAAFKSGINVPEWKNVPIYIKAGKFLNKSCSEINLVLKRGKNQKTNVISVRIGPEQEGIAILAYAKDYNENEKIRPITLEYCHKCEFGINTPESYERIISEMIAGNHRIFAGWKEVETSWKFIDRLIKNAKKSHLHKYAPKSSGPESADKLLNKDGREWVSFDRKITI